MSRHEPEPQLLVPLRSNASALLTGVHVNSVRRRLKCASVSFDQILLEAGLYTLQAGPGGSSGTLEPVPPADARWQTPAQRRAAKGTSFGIDMGREITPGVPAPMMHNVMASEIEACWSATFYPFARELPAGTDWIAFTTTRGPLGEIKRLTDQWTWVDKRNPALERAISDYFVRAAVIEHANRDAGYAAEQGMAVSVDPLHEQVISQRFYDESGSAMHGFAIPILFPEVGGLPWEAIVDLRRDRNIARYRAILREAEAEAVAAAAGGDLEAAAHRAYERKLANAQEVVMSIGGAIHLALRAFIVGSLLGAATMGISGPLGAVAGGATGAAQGVIVDVRDVLRQRRARGWISVHHQLDRLCSPSIALH